MDTSKRNQENNGEHRDSVREENSKLIERVRSMSAEQIVGYLVSAGVNTKDGKLTAGYQG